MTNADAIAIERAAGVDEELVSAFRRLVPQLSSSAPAPTADQLREMIESPCTTVLLARARAGIVGTRRETLALILGALRNEEIIDTRYRLIKILDRQRLLEASRDGYPTCVEKIVPVPLTGESCLAA